MKTYRLEGSKQIWDALSGHVELERLLDAAVARLGPSATRDGKAIVVRSGGEPSELTRRVSEKPYIIDGKSALLPYTCERPYACALEWGGSLQASRLMVFSGPTPMAGAVQLAHHGHHIYIEWAESRDGDPLVLYDGEPFAGRRRFSNASPHSLLVANREDLSTARQFVVFGDLAAAVWFSKRPRIEFGRYDMLFRTSLELAALRGQTFSEMLVRPASRSWENEVAALPANVTRMVAGLEPWNEPFLLSVTAIGAEDDLLVHADQLREHFANRSVTIADGIRRPGETPAALHERVLALLGAT